jgi:thioredoxin reductase (NADPH)
VKEAIYLTKFGRKVTIIHRRDQLRASRHLQELAFSNEKIEFLWNTVVEEIAGDPVTNRLSLRNVVTGERYEKKAEDDDGMLGIFILTGIQPATEIFSGKVKTDEAGYIITDERMRTNLPGVFAAGDVRRKDIRQAITAAADGAVAAVEAGRYIDGIDEGK